MNTPTITARKLTRELDSLRVRLVSLLRRDLNAAAEVSRLLHEAGELARVAARHPPATPDSRDA